jgi:hypothetical protein
MPYANPEKSLPQYRIWDCVHCSHSGNYALAGAHWARTGHMSLPDKTTELIREPGASGW